MKAFEMIPGDLEIGMSVEWRDSGETLHEGVVARFDDDGEDLVYVAEGSAVHAMSAAKLTPFEIVDEYDTDEEG